MRETGTIEQNPGRFPGEMQKVPNQEFGQVVLKMC